MGDTRLYLLRGGELILQTVDNHEHTLQWGSSNGVLPRMVNPNGAIAYPFTPAESADYHEYTRAAGGGILNPLGHLVGPENVSRATIEIKPGDTLLLSTDGLHGFIPFDVLQGLLKHNAHLPADERSRLLAETALDYMKAAGKEGDNATAIVADLVADKKGGLTFNPKVTANSNTYHASGQLRSKVLAGPESIHNFSFSAGTVVYYDEAGKADGVLLNTGVNLDGQTFPAGTRLWFDGNGAISAARISRSLSVKGLDLNAGSYLFYHDGNLTGAELFGQHDIFGVSHPHRTMIFFDNGTVRVKLKLNNGDTRTVNGIDYGKKSELVYSIYGQLTEARFFGSLTLSHFTAPVPPSSQLFFATNGDIEKIRTNGPLSVFGTEYPAGSTLILDNANQRVASVIIGADMGETKAGAQLFVNGIGETSAVKYNQEIEVLGVKFANGVVRKWTTGNEVVIPSTDLTIGEVAQHVGFVDPNYFTRVFSQEYGVSPKQYRRQFPAEA